MRRTLRAIPGSVALVLLAGTAWPQGAKPLTKCAPDAVIAGTVCMDTYEASVWRVPNATAGNAKLVKKIQQGKATAADLAAGGATQLGLLFDDYAPCAVNGQNCADDIFAVSLPGVKPSAYVTWFQAQAACENSRKRLPSNAEWQAAVAGTPDPGPDNGTTDCNSTAQPGQDPTPTGSRSSCKSARGAFDLVGNVDEWVADWVPRSSTCGTWSAGASPTGDDQCLAGAATTDSPGAIYRGGSFYAETRGNGVGDRAGPLAIGNFVPEVNTYEDRGFRCAR